MTKRITREKREAIHTLLRETELPHNVISERVGVCSVTVDKYAKKFLTKEELKARISKTYSNITSMENNPRWKGDKLDFVASGYRYVRAPEWWEGYTNSNIYAYEHQLVYAKHHGLTSIPTGYDIHHIDEDRLNNNVENLVMLTHGEHTALHHELRR